MTTIFKDQVVWETYGESISVGEALYKSTGTGTDSGRTAGRLYKLDVTNADRRVLYGIAKDAGTAGQANRRVVTAGRVEGFSGLTPGLPVYASAVTPGGYTQVAPTSNIQVLGIAQDVDTVLLNGALGGSFVPSFSSGGTGIGDPDVLLGQTFDTAVVGDFTQTGLELVSSGALRGDQSARLVHQAASTRSFKQTISVPPKFRGVNMTAAILLRSSASEGNVIIQFRDETNSVDYPTQQLQTNSQAIESLTTTNLSPTVSGFSNSSINSLKVGMSVTGSGIPTGTVISAINTTALTITLSQNATASATVSLRFSDLPRTIQLGFNIPANCSSYSYTISALQESGSPETYIDDVVLKNYWLGMSNQGQSEVSIEVPVVQGETSYTPTLSSTSGVNLNTAYYSRRGDNIFVRGSLGWNGAGAGSTFTVAIPSSLTIDTAKLSSTTGLASQLGKATWFDSGNAYIPLKVEYATSTSVSFRFDTAAGTIPLGSGFASGDFIAYEFSLPVKEWSVTEPQTFTTTDLVPAKAVLGNTAIDVPVLTDWQSYTPTFTGFGTPTNVEFQWRQNGENVEVRGKFTSGTSTATEARVSLPNGYTSANTSKIPSIQVVGKGNFSSNSAGDFSGRSVLIEPSVSYFTIGVESSGQNGTTKANGNQIASSGNILSFFASVPISGLSATEEVVVSGTQQALTQEADSYLQVSGNAGQSLTANVTNIPFANIQESRGSAISFNGTQVTALEDGIFNLDATIVFNASANTRIGLYKNGVVFSSSALVSSTVHFYSVQLRLLQNDVISLRVLDGGPHTLANAATHVLQISKQGSLKVAAVNADQKITIPTSELRFEGASSRGAVATAIVKFDTLAKIRGDAFTVVSDANNGTAITMTKAGRLHVSANIRVLSAMQVAITKNQANLTSFGSLAASEIIASEYSGGTDEVFNMSGTVDVVAGDVIRVSAGGNPSANAASNFLLSFQEQAVQVSVSNTLPQFSESDSSVRVDTANGYGSTATMIRRFSNVRDNLGTAIRYEDSATNGASFTILESGIYEISYSESFIAASDFGITKNVTSLSTNISTTPVANKLAQSVTGSANFNGSCSWQGYLVVGDVIRAHTDGAAASAPADGSVLFTISKVGKPNVTGVDVTPFIEIPQPESQAIRLGSGSAASGTDITNFTVLSNTNNGIVSYTSSNGRITALRRCTITTHFDARSTAAGDIYAIIQKNGSQVSAQYENGVGSAGYSSNTTFTGILEAGEYLTFATTGQANQNSFVSFTATALSDQILTAPETFSTDTAALQYASSSQYTLSTLANAPVGTFITFTYAASSNTRTQTTTAPTQTTADMNTNGILLYPRLYTNASTAGAPSTVAIQIGKGLKGINLGLYKSANKVTSGELDYYLSGTTGEFGAYYKSYDEKTGILLIDVGVSGLSSATTRAFAFSDITSQTSGYLVINASKNPALTGLGLNRIAARGLNTSGQSIPNNTTTIVTYDAAKTFDTAGALNAATGVFTAPETGYYQVNGVITYSPFAVVATVQVYLFKNNSATQYAYNNTLATTTNFQYGCAIADVVLLNKGDTLDMRAYQNSGSARTLLTSTGGNFFSVTKVSI